MLRKKCKKTCLHALLKLVLSRVVTKTLPMASRCIARTLARRRAARVRARVAALHPDPRTRSFCTLARHPITTRAARIAGARTPCCARHRAFRKAAWTKALRAMHGYARDLRSSARARQRALETGSAARRLHALHTHQRACATRVCLTAMTRATDVARARRTNRRRVMRERNGLHRSNSARTSKRCA